MPPPPPPDGGTGVKGIAVFVRGGRSIVSIAIAFDCSRVQPPVLRLILPYPNREQLNFKLRMTVRRGGAGEQMQL
jgi:hypothetical protein